MKIFILTSWLFVVLPSVLAGTVPQNCAEACFDSVSELSFNDLTQTLDYYTGVCNSTLLVQSMYACFGIYCSEYSSKGAWDTQAGYCFEYGSGIVIPDYDTVLPTLGDLSLIPVVNVTENAYVTMFNNTVVPDAHYFGLADKTLTVWYRTMHMHYVYGWCMYVLAAVVIFIGVTNRMLAIVFQSHTFTKAASDFEGKPFTTTGSFSVVEKINNMWSKHILLPATFGYRHVQPWGWCTIPTRIQSILIFIYVALNIIFSCLSYELFDNNTYWASTTPQIWRYIADRTGIMSFANLPLLFLFAGRNDLLLWLTGWPFSTFRIFHSWVARIATLQAIMHSIAYTICSWYDSNDWTAYDSYWKEEYWWNGAIATICMSLLIAFSFLPIRQKLYELFLAVHVLLSIVVLVACFYHVKIFGTEYNPYLWVCVGFWAFDRFARIARLALLNWRVFTSKKGSRATVSYDAGSDIIRLMVRPSTRFNAGPGLHYYIHTPTLTFKFWENHPFTLSTWGDVADGGIATPRPASSVEQTDDKGNTYIRAAETSSTGKDVQQLEFIIRPYKGMTKALKERLIKNPSETSIPIMIEGPYGTAASLSHYERVLLISGGSGVTATLAYLTKYGHTEQNIRFVCAVREELFLASLVAKELALFNGKPNVQLDLHITGNVNANSEKCILGRPNIITILDEEITKLTTGRLAVVVCGPARMNDDVRREVVRAIGTEIDASRISLHEEAFGW